MNAPAGLLGAAGLALMALCALAAGCGGESSGTSTPADSWHIVALGDSDATGAGDTTALGWVERYARLLRHRVHAKVDVINLAENGKTKDQLLSEIRTDPATRRQVGHASIVLIGIGAPT